MLSRFAGRKLVTLFVIGRKSGKTYAIPVAYTPYEGGLLVATPFAWGKNLRTGEPIEVQFRGKRKIADVQVIDDHPGVAQMYGVIARDNKQFASFNGIGYTPAGDPDQRDLNRIAAQGARAFLFTPH
ncbi:hypothetical protein GOEFS_105_00130 [Gordonia effusa NBRC 100432]|uniref:DUF385 domain-containing protein n=1 Tax=Gordonia effusa NBRC 100432 TaxID=1077974 RepID=H0R4K1_9ACTN|nr:hypothetical protein GOEFS_105_00130 [Gordonia effusa NBRC 100432]